MTSPVKPDAKQRDTIIQSASAEINLCWTCGSCSFECPVNIATDRLQPRNLVFMANLGLLDELVNLPDIWYCLQCRRCSNVCPMTVKPADLISFLRMEAISQQVVSSETFLEYERLYRQLHRVRWHAASHCLSNENGPDISAAWEEWSTAPVDSFAGEISYDQAVSVPETYGKAIDETGVASCYTCGECSSGCPVFGEKDVFDPRLIFRMICFGLTDQLLQSPVIWLCVDCRRCTDNCSQNVLGHQMIKHLQELAVQEGVVRDGFPQQWKDVNTEIYTVFLDKVDEVLK